MAIAVDVVSKLLPCDPASLINPPYHNEDAIRSGLRAANFDNAAIAMVQGSLIRVVTGQMDSTRHDETTNVVAHEFRRIFGEGAVAGETRSLAITAEKR